MFLFSSYKTDDIVNTPSEQINERLNRISQQTTDITDNDSFGDDGNNIEDIIDITEDLLDAVIKQKLPPDDPVVNVS